MLRRNQTAQRSWLWHQKVVLIKDYYERARRYCQMSGLLWKYSLKWQHEPRRWRKVRVAGWSTVGSGCHVGCTQRLCRMCPKGAPKYICHWWAGFMTANTDCLRCFISVYLESNLLSTCNGKVSKIVHLYGKCCIRETLMAALMPGAGKWLYHWALIKMN